jgi:hypothetical protein
VRPGGGVARERFRRARKTDAGSRGAVSGEVDAVHPYDSTRPRMTPRDRSRTPKGASRITVRPPGVQFQSENEV